MKLRLLIAKQFLSFLDDRLSKLKNKAIELIRLGSIFFKPILLDYLEQKVMDYIVAVKFTHPIQQII